MVNHKVEDTLSQLVKLPMANTELATLGLFTINEKPIVPAMPIEAFEFKSTKITDGEPRIGID